jgi:AraC-like DNA-binding protein
MLSSSVQTFSDPDDYAAAIRQGTVELTITGRGLFSAKLTKIALHSLWMQRLSDNLPRVSHTYGWGGRALIGFRTQPGPSLVAGGIEMQPTNIVRYAEGQSYHRHSSGFASYAGMSLPVADMISSATAMAGVDLTAPRDALSIIPLSAAMDRLQRLHAAAGDLAENAPEIIANPDAAHGLEQALIEAMVGCLADRESRQSRPAQGQHAIVMQRFRRVVEENPDQPLYIPDICKAIRVPARTLRMCCQEHLGMGPKRYLLLRRMHLVRRALRAAIPDTTSVTEIATRYGFWELGRFAVNYRSLFGELPSATLSRQSE